MQIPSGRMPRQERAPESIPVAHSLAVLLLLRPLELWVRMVMWRLDGDPGLAFIWPPKTSHQRAWIARMVQLLSCSVGALCTVLVIDYGWQINLMAITLGGFLVQMIIVCFVGLAFGVVLIGSTAVALLLGNCLPSKFDEIGMLGLILFAFGLSIRIGWTLSERIFDMEDASENRGEALSGGSRSNSDYGALILIVVAWLSAYGWGRSRIEWVALITSFLAGFFVHRIVGQIASRLVRRPFAFLSYRHHDERSTRLARRVHELKKHNTFLDEEMAHGEIWRSKLLSELRRATVLVAFEGPPQKVQIPSGLTAQDAPTFWVDLERGYAGRRGIPILPVAVDLDPEEMSKPLASRQAVKVRSEYSERDVNDLVKILEREYGI